MSGMDVHFLSTESKFEQVLEKLVVSETVEPVDQHYLEAIITHLSALPEDGAEWYRGTVLAWLSSHFGAIESQKWLQTFGLKLLGLLCEHESSFLSLFEEGVVEKARSWYDRGLLSDASSQLSFVLLLRKVIRHSAGLAWMKKHELWKIAVTQKLKRTVYIVREMAHLLHEVLLRFDEVNDASLCRSITKQILSPFILGVWFNPGDIISVDDKENHKVLIAALENLERIFISIVDSGRPSRVVYYLIVTHQLHKKLVSSTMASYDSEFLSRVRRCLAYTNVLQLSFMLIPEEDTLTQPLGLRRFCLSFFNLIGHCIQKRDCRDILMITELYSYLWHKVERLDLVPQETPVEGNYLKFSDQILILQLLPVIHSIQVCSEPTTYLEEFCMKLFSASCEHTIRHLYGFRDVIIETNSKADLAQRSAQGLVAMSNHVARDSAALAFQALIYIFGQYVPHVQDVILPDGTLRKNLVVNCANLLSTILGGIAVYIEKFNLDWKDCLEATTIAHLSLTLLNNPAINTRISVKALILVKLSIEHFLSPNMVLLMDSLEGTSLENLGPTIVKKLRDSDSDVRDSTLELVCSIVEISRRKFPAFQKHLLTHNICEAVWELADSDRDVIVRSSALCCVAKMVTIKNYWSAWFGTFSVTEKLIGIVHTDPEGRIRRQATNALAAISSHQQLSPVVQEQLFASMAFLATNDMCYDVRTSAVDFWRLYLDELFHNQGALSGKFPPQTFSKENKKIVQLTSVEILRRLEKIIKSFGQKGGFGVLLDIIYDESDLQVLKAAVSLLEFLMSRLREYGYVKNEPEEAMVTDDPVPSMENLTRDYEKLTAGDESGVSLSTVQETFGRFIRVESDEFIRVVSGINLDDLLKTKQEWLRETNNFDSLLEDVLLALKNGKYDLECF